MVLWLMSCLLQSPQVDVYTDVTIVDCQVGRLISHQCMEVTNGLISAIHDTSVCDHPSQVPNHQLTGTYLIPGFMDLHVHFPADGRYHQAILDRLLEFGITTILNPGARPEAGVRLRTELEQGVRRGPRMFTAGRIIDSPPSSEDLKPWAAIISNREEMEAEIEQQAMSGVDFIKLYKHVPPDLFEAGINRAHQLGLKVIGHMGATTWTQATEMGVDMLVHSGYGTPMDEWIDLPNAEEVSDQVWYEAYAAAPTRPFFSQRTLKMRKMGVSVVPTLAITEAAAIGKDASMLARYRTDLAPAADLPGWWGEGWRNRHSQYGDDLSPGEDILLETIYLQGVFKFLLGFHNADIKIGVGTDVGNAWMTPGHIYHYELELYQKAGIPPAHILNMATAQGAEILGIAEQVGDLVVGKQADFIVLDRNPLEDIRHSRSIRAVYKRGTRVSGSVLQPFSPKP
ncbi:MAG: amidohydrolase family protein [Acidobacteria bacterium]|nr:amidohydrolase family protein [Acidobacteriota bacterium]